jgi:hypothetical protein
MGSFIFVGCLTALSASDGEMTGEYEMERIWKEAAVN